MSLKEDIVHLIPDDMHQSDKVEVLRIIEEAFAAEDTVKVRISCRKVNFPIILHL